MSATLAHHIAHHAKAVQRRATGGSANPGAAAPLALPLAPPFRVSVPDSLDVTVTQVTAFETVFGELTLYLLGGYSTSPI